MQTMRESWMQSPMSARTSNRDRGCSAAATTWTQNRLRGQSRALSPPGPQLPDPRLPDDVGGTIGAADAAPDEPAAPKAEPPRIEIEKTAPATAVLGRPMIYQIHVRNVGHNAAHQVVVEDVVPEGVKIDGSIPQAL